MEPIPLYCERTKSYQRDSLFKLINTKTTEGRSHKEKENLAGHILMIPMKDYSFTVYIGHGHLLLWLGVQKELYKLAFTSTKRFLHM